MVEAQHIEREVLVKDKSEVGGDPIHVIRHVDGSLYMKQNKSVLFVEPGEIFSAVRALSESVTATQENAKQRTFVFCSYYPSMHVAYDGAGKLKLRRGEQLVECTYHYFHAVARTLMMIAQDQTAREDAIKHRKKSKKKADPNDPDSFDIGSFDVTYA